MKRLFYLIVTLFLFPTFLFSQHLEIGGAGGFSTYSGDLNPSNRALSHGEFRYAISGFIRYHHNDYFTSRLGVTAGRLSARDVDSESPGRRARGLSFKSTLLETSFVVEFNILGYEPKFLTRTFSPYVFLGVGAFAFNPKTIYQGEWIELQPLHTEGQGLAEFPERKPYKKVAIAIPFGVGLKYALTDRINIGAEAGLRRTNTDYIDDVSTTYAGDDILNENYGPLAAALSNRSSTTKTSGQQRGSADHNDWYMTSMVTISYNLINNGYKKKRRRAMGCPTF